MIEFSSFGSIKFLSDLRQLSIDQDAPTQKHMRILRRGDLHDKVSAIEEGFATAKRLLEARVIQYTDFLTKPPWSLVSLLEYLLPQTDEASMQSALARSRERALKFLEAYNSNQLGNVGDVGEKFLRGQHRRALERWGQGLDHFMNQPLFRELVGWASSLLVMQRLEAKHHLVHAPLA